MKKQSNDNLPLIAGELYLFHTESADCPSEESLWGIVDRREGGRVHLESSSRDLRSFQLWQPLMPEYRYCRLATRSELRDYSYNLAWWECGSRR